MRTGAEHAAGDVLVFLDGDGTNPPEMIPDLVMELRDTGMVLGSRGAATFDEDDFLWRLYFLLHKVWIGPVFKLAGLDLKDPLTGFRAIRKNDWEKLSLETNHFDIETEINIRAHECGLNIKEIPVPNLKRYGGESKFITSTKDWGRIVKYVANYKKDKIKERLKI
jgi:dolichol-phosphate mannosyltransferase